MQDTAVCSEPVSRASLATMGLSQARAGTCQVLFMGGSGPFSAAYGALMSGTYALRAAYGVLMSGTYAFRAAYGALMSRTCPLMDVPYAFMGVPGLCMALACTEAVYAG